MTIYTSIFEVLEQFSMTKSNLITKFVLMTIYRIVYTASEATVTYNSDLSERISRLVGKIECGYQALPRNLQILLEETKELFERKLRGQLFKNGSLN